MSDIQDPQRQIGYLQQCLSSDKKPLGLFLGAGCPMAIRLEGGTKPLIPDIEGITQSIRDKFAKTAPLSSLLETIDGHFKHDGRSNTTVEDMLTHIRALRAVAGKDRVRGLSAKDLDDLDDNICRLIHEIANIPLPNMETPYHRIASWVGAIQRKNPVEIFTTNYDLLMEQAFESMYVPYFDGFAGVQRPFFDLRAMEEDCLPPRWARLWKLHGSVNWYQAENKAVFRGTATESGSSKRVIHPSHLKYQESRRMPYLAMIDRLRAFLKQPTATLILCGYSFRDEHINEVIVDGLQSTQSAIAFAMLFDKISSYPQAQALARKRSNLNILAHDGAVIGSQDSKWPEKDAGAVSAGTDKWVKWAPVDPANTNGKMVAKFAFGDFAVFSQFLQELSGSARELEKVTSA